jgi:hypothetical protein
MNVVTIKQDPTPAEKPVEGQNQQQQNARPAWLPEKFKTPEDMAKAYGELEQKQGAKKPEGEKPPTDAKAEGEKPKEQKEQPLPPSLKKFQDEYAKNGKLSEESYAELDSRGIDRTTVDNHIQATKAQGESGVNSVYEAVGGADVYKAMVEWAITGLSKEDADAYDRAVESGDIAQVKLAVKGLHAEYSRANPKAPTKITGTPSGAASAVTPFTHMREFVEAAKDPRYKTDYAYRKSVEDRLAASNL